MYFYPNSVFQNLKTEDIPILSKMINNKAVTILLAKKKLRWRLILNKR